MKKYIVPVIFLAVFMMAFLSACDKVEPPYKESGQVQTDTGKVRKILLEEFTGHQCPNCPQGAIIAQQLKTMYGEKLILISIHAGDFADIMPSGDFTYNFKTPVGDELNTFFGVWGYPTGIISRTGYPSNIILGKDAWGPKIETIRYDSPKASIKIINIYDQTARNLNSLIVSEALMDLTGTYKICAYLTEDSIIKPQQFPGSISYQYVHRHVLRGALNNTWGDILFSGTTPANKIDIENYSMALNSAWNENHCYVVAFIYDVANYEIIQVEEKRVK